jgi:hypothetical protein
MGAILYCFIGTVFIIVPVVEGKVWHCQTKAALCQKPYEPAVSGRKLTPLGKRGGAVEFEVPAVVKMTFLIEVIVNRRMDRSEFL